MRNTYRLMYRLGLRPWEQTDIPEPLVQLEERLKPVGVAVDIGCGTGAQARFLAEQGWQVTGVDFIERALGIARSHDPAGHVTWRLADATDLAQVDPDGELAGRCRLIVDNGCLHGIAPDGRTGWASTVEHLADPAAHLLVRASGRSGRRVGPAGISAAEITGLLGPTWQRDPEPAPGWHAYHRLHSGH
jgi:SAM-dependent methyltransferase